MTLKSSLDAKMSNISSGNTRIDILSQRKNEISKLKFGK